jgi:putative transcriptional regulator
MSTKDLHLADLLDDPRAMEAHAAACGPCRQELEALARLAFALPGVPPAAELRARVLADATAHGRFEAFAARVAALLGQPLELARALLDRIDVAASWEAGPAEGTALLHLPPGPELAADTLCGFVRVDPGVTFPLHRHRGDERVLVLQGGLRDRDGTMLRRGEEASAAGGTEHDFVALPGPPLVYLVVLEKGVDFPGLPGFVV